MKVRRWHKVEEGDKTSWDHEYMVQTHIRLSSLVWVGPYFEGFRLIEVLKPIKYLIMNIVNLTPHDLNMVDMGVVYPRTEVAPGRILTIRASQTSEEVGEVNGHILYKSTFGKPYFCTVDTKGQDEQPYNGTVPEADYYVVSIISLQAIQANGGCEQFTTDEFLSPGKLVRDEEGKIVGSTGFSIL